MQSAIWRRRLALVAVLLLGLAGLAGWWRAVSVREATRARWERSLHLNASITAAAIEEWAHERHEDAATLAVSAGSMPAAFPAEESFAAPTSGAAARKLLRELLTASLHRSRYSSAWAVTPQGLIAASSESAGALTPGELDLAQDVARGGTRRIWGPERLGTDSFALTLAAPVVPSASSQSGDGRRPIGAVLLRLDPATSLFRRVLRDPLGARTGESGLVTRRGDTFVLLASLRDAPMSQVRLWTHAPLPGRRAAEGVDTTGEFLGLTGTPILAATRGIPGTPWGIVRRIDLHEAMADYRRQIRTELALALAVLVAAGGSVLAGRRAMRIAKLRHVAISEARLAGIIYSATDAIITFDDTQRIMLMNEAAARLLRCTPAEGVNRPLSDFIPARHHERNAAAFEEYLDGGGGTRHMGGSRRFLVRCATGEEIPVKASVSSSVVSGERVHTIVFHDITERVHAENALRDSEAGFRAFVEHSPYGIFRSTMDGRFLAVNAALVRMLGYDSAQALMETDLQHVCCDAEDCLRLSSQCATADHFAVYDMRWNRADTGEITVRLTGRCVRGQDGSASFLEMFVEDVTQLRNTEGALRQAEKLAAVGELVAGVSHEINNPLTSILAFTEMLVEDVPAGETRESLTLIHQQALRVKRIVRDLLAFAGTRTDGRTAIPIGDLVTRSVAGLMPELDRLGVRLDADIPARSTTVLVDINGMEQVLTNLVLNGAQAGGAGSTVRVSVGQEDSSVVVRVEDTGPGVPSEVIGRIFEPFFTTKPTGQGTGLGLSVSLGIVQQHDGTITASNRPASVGGGACFTVRLPGSATPRVQPPPRLAIDHRAGGDPPTGASRARSATALVDGV